MELNARLSDPLPIRFYHRDRIEKSCAKVDEKVKNSEFNSSRDEESISIGFLQQMEPLDPSGITTFYIDTLRLIKTNLRKRKKSRIIDVVTSERIFTEFVLGILQLGEENVLVNNHYELSEARNDGYRTN